MSKLRDRSGTAWFRLVTIVLVALGLTRLVSAKPLLLTSPHCDETGCASAKPTDFVIKLPWDDSITHTSLQDYGSGFHQGVCRTGQVNDYHALDFDLDTGNSVRAIASGQVVYAGWAEGGWSSYGQVVIIDHQNGYQALYAHLNSVDVSDNQWVQQKQKIGEAGGTGGWDPHLHFSLYHDAAVMDPGGPYGGCATVPEYFRGVQDYEDLGHGMDLTSEGSDTCTAPSLSEPSDGAPVGSRTVTFSWDPPETCPGLDVYTFRVVDDESKINSGPWIIEHDIDIPQTWTVETFDQDREYWWAVWPCRGCNSGSPDYGERSDVWSFRIDSSPPQSCNPSTDQVALYDDPHRNDGGSCVTLNIGEYPNPGTWDNLSNDAASSVRVGSNVQAVLCEDDDYRGRCETFTSDDGDLADNYIGDGVVSSVRVQSRCPSAPTLSSPPDGGSYTEGTRFFSLMWNDVAGATEYIAEYWGGPGSASGWQATTSWYVEPQVGYTYYWHVKARNDFCESGWSDTWAFTARPAAPLYLIAQPASCTDVDLGWNCFSASEDGYKIYRNDSYIDQVGVNATSYRDTGLSGNTSYSYYVKAFRGSIESAASSTASVSTPSCCNPDTDQVALYADTDYQGSCVTLNVGDHPNPGYLGNLGDDNAESIKVGNNAQARLCERADYLGRCETFTGDDSYLWDNTIGGNVVSSVQVQPRTSDWHVEYYSDGDLGTRCHEAYQGGTYVFGDWDNDAPASGCPSEYFSARFSRSVDFPGGDYTFALGYDDGARIKVDGQTVVDGWAPSAQHYETVNLSSGYHSVEVEYYENMGDAYLTAFWWGLGFDVSRQSRDNSQWYAQYWGNRALWWDSVVRVNEGQGFLNHQWDMGGPGYNLPTNRFSSRFERTVHFPCGRWRFDLSSDDGVRFWIDGDLILDEWRDQVETFSREVDLSDGEHQLKVEHYERSGGANIQMSWVQLSECDTTPPSGRITSPPDGAVIGACPLTMQAEASDGESGVDFVEFYANYDDGSGYGWHHLGDDDTSPYVWNWDCSSLDDQYLLLTIHIRDHAGNEVVEPGGRVDIELNRQPGVALVSNSSHIVRPGQEFDPFATVRVTSGQLDSTRGDHLHAIPEGTSNTLGAWPVQPVNHTVDVGQTYVFNTSNDISFRMTAPDADGDYESIWRVRADGDHIGPTIAIPVTVDGTPPSGRVLTPADDAILNADTVYIEAEASDNVGIDQVQFFAWYSNEWHFIDRDRDGSDGYQVTWDVSDLSDRSGIGLDALILDRVWNRWDATVNNLKLDRTPPNVIVEVSPAYDDASFRDFWITWWHSSDSVSGIASYDVQYRDGAGGDWRNLVINTTEAYWHFVGLDGHTYYFRVRARDMAGNESTYASGDGDAHYTVDVCDVAPDVYEADDIVGNAQWISTDGTLQIHNIHTDGDRDWVRFRAAAGITYTLVTTNTGGYADTVLYLYGTDGVTLIDSDDDHSGVWSASRLDWQPEVSGLYYAMVNHWHDYAYGCTTEYGLSIVASGETPCRHVHLPLVLRNFDLSNPPAEVVRTLNFKVSFQARDNSAGKPQNVPIKVSIENPANDQVLFESNWTPVTPAGSGDNWGTASVDVSSVGLRSGQTYEVVVRGAMHLAKQVTLPLTDNMTIDYTDPSLNLDGVLWTCDVDQDNQVTQADVNIQISHFFETPPASPVPSSEVYRSDQDGDGAVGSADWTICIRNSGKVGDLYHPMPTVETLRFTVAYQGRDNSVGRPQNVPIKVIIEKLATGQVLFESDWVSVTPASGSDNWGTASVDVSSAGLIPGQSYEVFVRGAMHLARSATVSLTDGMMLDYTDPDLNPDGLLWAGDINQDNKVTTIDLEAVAWNWGKTCPVTPDPSSVLYRSDLNGDGTIGFTDLIMCSRGRPKGDPY